MTKLFKDQLEMKQFRGVKVSFSAGKIILHQNSLLKTLSVDKFHPCRSVRICIFGHSIH